MREHHLTQLDQIFVFLSIELVHQLDCNLFKLLLLNMIVKDFIFIHENVVRVNN